MERYHHTWPFLDVCKTYGCMWRVGLWCKIRHYGEEEKFVMVCEGLYSEM